MLNPLFGLLTVSVLVGCISTLAAVVVGVHRASKRAAWDDGDRNVATATIATLLIVWFTSTLTLAWSGFFHAGATRVPTIQFGLLIPLAVGIVLFWSWPLLCRLVDSVPQSWIIGIQFFRIEGAIFLILLAAGRLPGVFAWPAGVGDILVGLLAPLVARASVRNTDGAAATIRAWNLLGLADLVIALTTGFLSSPSPLQVFAFDRPNALITEFPLVLIPVFLVPLAFLLHFASLQKLRQASARPARLPLLNNYQKE